MYISTLCMYEVPDTLYYYVVFTYVSTCPKVHLCSCMYLNSTYVSLSLFKSFSCLANNFDVSQIRVLMISMQFKHLVCCIGAQLLTMIVYYDKYYYVLFTLEYT